MYGKNVVIVSCKRTCIGLLMGSLSNFSAVNLGSIAIRGALASTRLENSEIEEVIMGQALQAASGQAPARQAALGAELSQSTPCTTINYGFASGMKSVMLAAQMISCGQRKVVLAGGMESMTNTPHYMSIREPIEYSHRQFVDCILLDNYTERIENNDLHLGN